MIKFYIKSLTQAVLSSVWLCSSIDYSPLAPLPLEFSRQEYWSGCHSYSRGSSHPRDWTHVYCASCIGRQVLELLVPPGKPSNKASCPHKIYYCFHTQSHLNSYSKIKSKKKNACFLNASHGYSNGISFTWDLFTYSLHGWCKYVSFLTAILGFEQTKNVFIGVCLHYNVKFLLYSKTNQLCVCAHTHTHTYIYILIFGLHSHLGQHRTK